jgi:hypothetical protein
MPLRRFTMRTSEELYNLYIEANKADEEKTENIKKKEDSGINIMPQRRITIMAKSKGTLFSKINRTTKNTLGSVGRPVVVGGTTALAAYKAGEYFELEQLTNPWVFGGIGAATAVGAEAAFYLWGDDGRLHAEDAVAALSAAIDSEEDAESIYEYLTKSGMGEEGAQAVVNTITAGREKKKEKSTKKVETSSKPKKEATG